MDGVFFRRAQHTPSSDYQLPWSLTPDELYVNSLAQEREHEWHLSVALALECIRIKHSRSEPQFHDLSSAYQLVLLSPANESYQPSILRPLPEADQAAREAREARIGDWIQRRRNRNRMARSQPKAQRSEQCQGDEPDTAERREACVKKVRLLHS